MVYLVVKEVVQAKMNKEIEQNYREEYSEDFWKQKLTSRKFWLAVASAAFIIYRKPWA